MVRATRPQSAADLGGTFLKVEILNDAFSQMRINGLTRQPTPGDLELMLKRLENMAAEFNARNMDPGWNFEDEPDPNSVTNIQRAYFHTYATNVAVRTLPDFGMSATEDLRRQANQSLSFMSASIAANRVDEVFYSIRHPKGAGNDNYYNRWSRFYQDERAAANVSNLAEIFVDDVNDFNEQFNAYLRKDETVTSFDIVVDKGLELISSSLVNGQDVVYRIRGKADSESQRTATRQVTIIATTSDDRVQTRRRYFQVVPRDDERRI